MEFSTDLNTLGANLVDIKSNQINSIVTLLKSINNVINSKVSIMYNKF